MTVLKHEGLFVDDPQDPGGATKFGVSLRWLKSIGYLDHDGILDGDFDLDGDVDSDDIKKLTYDDARHLYRKHWWEKYQYDKINHQIIATKIFDFSVNMGSKQAHKCVQRAIRSANGIVLLEDGVLGVKSLDAINSANHNLLLVALRSEAAGFYRALNKPKYLNGWLNRAYA